MKLNLKIVVMDARMLDTTTGYPTRAALESLGLGYVADELEAHDKPGSKLGTTIQKK